MGLLNVFKAATPEGQDWLDKLLRDAGSVDLPDKAVDQAYATVPFHNVGAKGVVSYDLNAPRANNINAPAGIYSNVDKKWSDNYLKSQEEFTGQQRAQNTLVTTGRNVFVAGADKPTEQMLQAVREQMSRKAAGISYGDLPSHQRGYIDEKIDAFAATGDPTTLPTSFINAQDKNKIFADAGFDILLRNGNEFVHLKPEQTRSIDAEFNPELKGTNNWMAGVGGLGLLGAAAISPEDAEASPLKAVQRLIDAGYPESVAKRIASGELPMDNASRMARAAEQGNTETMYHGSMQDITGEYIPRYSDGMMFVTPSPQFASDWAGKGAMQTRAGELDSYDRAKPQIDALYAQMGSPEAFTPEYDKFDELRKIIMQQERNAFKTVYPLAVRTGNIFDPSAAGAYEDVTKPLFERLGRNPDEIEQYLRDANYLTFEDADVASELRNLGYDSVRLREDVSKPADTVAMLDGSANVRSLLAAAFDPEYKGKNILGINGGSNGVAGKIVDTASTAAQNAAIDYALSQASDRAPDLGSIEPVEPGYRDRARDYIAEALGGERKDYRMAEKLMSVGDYLPFVGGASGAADTVDAYNEGDVLGTVLGAAGTLAGVVPFARQAASGAGGLLGNIIERVGDFDPRFSPRKLTEKNAERLQNMEIDYDPVGQQEVPTISLADYEGYPLITSMSDRTAAGRILNAINGVPLRDPVVLGGGQGYMFDSPHLWASAKKPVNDLAKLSYMLEKGTGLQPLYAPWRMAPTGGDFTPMTGNTMLGYAATNMTKKTKKQLDKEIKQIDPDWVGIDSPESISRFESLRDAQRKKIKQVMDVKFRNEGGLGIDEARLAVSDPLQRPESARVGLIQNVGMFDSNAQIVPSGRSEYPFSITGQGLGQVDTDIPIWSLLQADARARGVVNPAEPSQQDMRALMMKPYATIIDSGLLKMLGF